MSNSKFHLLASPFSPTRKREVHQVCRWERRRWSPHQCWRGERSNTQNQNKSAGSIRIGARIKIALVLEKKLYKPEVVDARRPDWRSRYLGQKSMMNRNWLTTTAALWNVNCHPSRRDLIVLGKSSEEHCYLTSGRKKWLRTLQFDLLHDGGGLSWRLNAERDIMFGAWMVVSWGTDYCVQKDIVFGAWTGTIHVTDCQSLSHKIKRDSYNQWVIQYGEDKICLVDVSGFNSEPWEVAPETLTFAMIVDSWPTFAAYPKILLNHPFFDWTRSCWKFCDIGAISEPIKLTPCATFWSFPWGCPLFLFDTSFVCSDLLIESPSKVLEVDSFGRSWCGNLLIGFPSKGLEMGSFGGGWRGDLMIGFHSKDLKVDWFGGGWWGLLIGFPSKVLRAVSFGGGCNTRKSQDLSILANSMTTENHLPSTCTVTPCG